MENHRGAGFGSHYRQHVSWPDAAGVHFFLIAVMYAVNEIPVPLLGCVEVVTESAIDKWVDHIAKTGKKLKMKILKQQRKDVLRPYALETFRRAIPVFKELLVTL